MEQNIITISYWNNYITGSAVEIVFILTSQGKDRVKIA